MKKIILATLTLLHFTTTYAQEITDLSVVLKDNFDNSVDFHVFSALTDIDGNYLFDLESVDIDFGDGSLSSYPADANESVIVTHTYQPGSAYMANLIATFSDTMITRVFPIEIGACAAGYQPVTFGLYEAQFIGTGSIDVFYPRMDNTTWSFSLDNNDPLTTTRSFCLAQEDCGSVYLEGDLGAYANVYCTGAEEFPLSPDPLFPFVQLCPELLCLADITEISTGIGYVELSVNQTTCPSVNWYVNGELQAGHNFTETLYFPTDGIYSIMVTDTCGDCNQAVSTFYQVEGGNVFLLMSGNDDEDEETEISVYPNPVRDELQIQSATLIGSVEIVDISGRLIIRESNVFSTSHTLDFSDYANGNYLVRIIDDNGKTQVRQIIK